MQQTGVTTPPKLVWYDRLLKQFDIPTKQFETFRIDPEVWDVSTKIRYDALENEKNGSNGRVYETTIDYEPVTGLTEYSTNRAAGSQKEGGLKRYYGAEISNQYQNQNQNQNTNDSKNDSCNKWWLLPLIVLVIAILAAVGVLLYFTICHWAGSCGNNNNNNDNSDFSFNGSFVDQNQLWNDDFLNTSSKAFIKEKNYYKNELEQIYNNASYQYSSVNVYSFLPYSPTSVAKVKQNFAATALKTEVFYVTKFISMSDDNATDILDTTSSYSTANGNDWTDFEGYVESTTTMFPTTSMALSSSSPSTIPSQTSTVTNSPATTVKGESTATTFPTTSMALSSSSPSTIAAQTSTVTNSPATTETITCLGPSCLNNGQCVSRKGFNACECPDGIKTVDCYCSNFPACCNQSDFTISGTKNFETAKMAKFSNGYCDWNFLPNITNANFGGALTLQIIDVQFDSTTTCETDYIIIYKNSVIHNDINLIGKFCYTNQDALKNSSFTSPSFSMTWSTTKLDQNLIFVLDENDVDYCEGDPCGQGGTCESLQTTFFCTCPVGMAGSGPGTPCIDQTICSLSPPICQNGGTCSSTDSSDFICNCRNNYTGQFCETSSSDANN